MQIKILLLTVFYLATYCCSSFLGFSAFLFPLERSEMLALACNCIYILCEVVVLVHAWGLIIIILFAFACKHVHVRATYSRPLLNWCR